MTGKTELTIRLRYKSKISRVTPTRMKVRRGTHPRHGAYTIWY